MIQVLMRREEKGQRDGLSTNNNAKVHPGNRRQTWSDLERKSTVLDLAA